MGVDCPKPKRKAADALGEEGESDDDDTDDDDMATGSLGIDALGDEVGEESSDSESEEDEEEANEEKLAIISVLEQHDREKNEQALVAKNSTDLKDNEQIADPWTAADPWQHRLSTVPAEEEIRTISEHASVARFGVPNFSEFTAPTSSDMTTTTQQQQRQQTFSQHRRQHANA